MPRSNKAKEAWKGRWETWQGGKGLLSTLTLGPNPTKWDWRAMERLITTPRRRFLTRSIDRKQAKVDSMCAKKIIAWHCLNYHCYGSMTGFKKKEPVRERTGINHSIHSRRRFGPSATTEVLNCFAPPRHLNRSNTEIPHEFLHRQSQVQWRSWAPRWYCTRIRVHIVQWMTWKNEFQGGSPCDVRGRWSVYAAVSLKPISDRPSCQQSC